MPDDYPTVVTYSFGQRIWHAILGVFLGPVFVIGAAILLFWNEHHAIKVANSLKEGAASVIELDASTVDPSLDGKLVHVSRDAKADGALRDPAFGVQTSGLRLLREVGVFEWEESRRSERHNNETTYYYSYRTGWHDHLISSGSFHDHLGHQNPSSMAYQSTQYNAPAVHVGAYQLDPGLIAQIKDSQPLSLTADGVKLPVNAHLVGGSQIFVGRDPQSPQVGDLRITEKVVPVQQVSIVAAVQGGRLASYRARAGGEIALVRPGGVDAPTMFAAAQASNSNLAWVFRGLGLGGLYLGLRCILGPLTTLATFVPLLGGIVEEGIGIVCLLGAGVMWLVLVAVSWITARPLLSGGLLVMAVLTAGLLVSKAVRGASARRARLAAGPPPMGGDMPPVSGVG